MLISDLNHFSTASEASDIVGGGYKKDMKDMMKKWMDKHKDDGKSPKKNGGNGGSSTSVTVKQVAKSKANAFSKKGDAKAVSTASNEATIQI